MLITDIKRVIEQVSRDKGIAVEVLAKTLEEALKSAARKKFGNQIDIEAHYSPESGEIEVFQFKEVVETITNPDVQISLEEGRELDPECEVGDSLGTKMDTGSFGRIAAQSAKQVIIQKMKDAEKDAIYSSFIDRKGEIINGIVQRIDRGDIIVNIGQTEAILPQREQLPKEAYRRGDRIRANIMKVLSDSRGPQIVLSRTHPDFLINLFKTEVPEISEGIVTIQGAAREAGNRAKIAVGSSDFDIDPVGACVGMKGSRVQNVVQELRGEKIDIIPWHVDAAKFVCNALAPAEISRVIIDEENNSMEVIVPDEFLSVAIGKRGQNVRLASKLTGWHLDVQSESVYSQAMKEGYDSLMGVSGVSIGLADILYEKGFFSAEELGNAAIEDLIQIRGIDGEEKARELIHNARLAVEHAKTKAVTVSKEEGGKNEPVANGENLTAQTEAAVSEIEPSGDSEVVPADEDSATDMNTNDPGQEADASTDTAETDKE
ncbi:MAG: transcription termination factor NusA [Desulfobacteraceae bacterium]|nr:MAG: transcription termination factor NusA [Desulfobacteraceae bacterium]